MSNDLTIKEIERYGIVNWLPLGEKHGLKVGVVNIFCRLANDQTFDDAALIMCRKTFGFGRMNVTLMRKQAFEFQNDETLVDEIAMQAAQQLFRSESLEDALKIATIVEYAIDDLILHPPEDQIIERKRVEREMETLGLVIKANDKILVDAR